MARLPWVILPLITPIMYLFDHYVRAGIPELAVSSFSFLSLPVPVRGSENWLDFWVILDDSEGKVDLLEVAPDNPETVAVPVEVEDRPDRFPISVFGYIQEDDERIYCLYDERNGRWFRLPEGEVDEKSQVKAEWDPEAGIACLYSLETGVHYRIKPGTREMERVEND